MVFVHGSWLMAPKTLDISWEIRAMAACCVSSIPENALEPSRRNACLLIHHKPLSTTGWVYVNKVTFRNSLKSGAGCQGNQPGMEGWHFQSHALISREGRGEGLEVKPITSGQRFNQPCPCNEAPVKIKRMRFRELAGWGNRAILRVTVPGPRRHKDRSSFVWDLAPRISSSGY